MPHKLKSAIAVITYQRLDALKAMLRGLRQYCGQYPTAIFEDCGVKDGTSAYLRVGKATAREDLLAVSYDWEQGLKTFVGTENLGVAGNSNRALKWFMDETDCDHLLLCNDDLHVLGDFAGFYAQAHQDLDVGLFCFNDFWESPTHRWAVVRSRGYRVKVFQRMTGIMLSVLRSGIDKIGYFDTRFGAFGEEHPCPGESLVWMGDYGFKPISDIRVGDTVIGWAKRQKPAKRYGNEIGKAKGDFLCDTLLKSTVLGILRLERPLVEVRFASGRTVRCAQEHTWLNYYGSNPENKMYVPAEPGRSLVHVIEPTAPRERTLAYWNGYVHGLVEGDGGLDHGVVVQRTTRKELLRTLYEALGKLHIKFTTREWDYAAVKPNKRRFTPEDRVLTITSLDTNSDFLSWRPCSEEERRGWLAGIYDADGYGRSFGQCPFTHASVYALIQENLEYFGFKVKPQHHQLYLKGGWRELVRFWNLCQPVLAYKLDDTVLVGRFKTQDRVISVTPLPGVKPVYCLKTSTGNYVIQGYASKNCDWTNRLRFAGMIKLDGLDQMNLDVEPTLPNGDAGAPVLKHQDVPTSVSGGARERADAVAAEAMKLASQRYMHESHYRAFSLIHREYAGGSATSGISTSEMQGYSVASI
jgi:hypothetical protein